MKKLLVILSFMLLHQGLMSQPVNDTIKINDDLQLIRLSPAVWMHVSFANVPGYGRVSGNGIVYVNGNEAFLFDTPWTDSLTKDLVLWLKEKMGIKIAGFVPNHWHNDCIGGLGWIKSQKIVSYANRMTVDLAKAGNLPVPDNSFSDSVNLKLGDKIIECYYPGPAHSTDNIVVWLPSERILFAGCMVKSIDAPNLGNISDGDIKAYSSTLEKVSARYSGAMIVVPGHGSPGGRELIAHTMELAKKTQQENLPVTSK